MNYLSSFIVAQRGFEVVINSHSRSTALSPFVRLYSLHETDLETPNRAKSGGSMPILQEADPTSRQSAFDLGLFTMPSLWCRLRDCRHLGKEQSHVEQVSSFAYAHREDVLPGNDDAIQRVLPPGKHADRHSLEVR
jgi:hypothetical protein